MEQRFFTEPIPEVSTAQWHAPRDRAPHLEQEGHRPRLDKALEYVKQAGEMSAYPYPFRAAAVTVLDLGCGDGGLLSMVAAMPGYLTAGYDFTPANVAGAQERGVNVTQADFLELPPWPRVDITVMTETLEHMADPHRWLALVALRTGFLVASSPWNETHESHVGYHVWGWDMEGYANMIRNAGFEIVAHEPVGLFQVVLARSTR